MSAAVYVVTANELNLRKQGDLDAPITAILLKGTQVERLGQEDDATHWWLVKASGVDSPGYVSRRYLASQSAGATSVPTGANEILWSATQTAINAHVHYLLGAKHSSEGIIDCSGWVAEITAKAFDAANRAAAPEMVFHKPDYSVLYTHSDGIVTGIEARTGMILHGNDVSVDKLREGMLIGCNFGDYTWEHDNNPPRIYGIDHIVQVVRDPSGSLFITQSSSSGNGVNVVPLISWLNARRQNSMMQDNHIHAVDPFAMADRNTRFMTDISVLAAAPVQATNIPSVINTASPPTNLAAFSGRGAYIYTINDVIHRYGSIEAAIKEMARCRLNHIWVRIHGRGYVGDAKGSDPNALKNLIAGAKGIGLKVAGWGWCQGEDIPTEIDLAKHALNTFGLDSYIADIEQNVNNSQWTASDVTQYLSGLRGGVVGLCITSHGFIDWFDPEIFDPFKGSIDCVNPQVYWYSTSPSQKMLTQVQANPKDYTIGDPASYAKLCAYRWRKLYGRPLVITGQAYSDGDFTDEEAEAKLKTFIQDYQPPSDVTGINYWYWGAMTPTMRDLIAAS